MAVSKERSDWALLLLRFATGGYAIARGVEPLLHCSRAVTLPNALRLGTALLELVCGGLMVVGVWLLPASLAVAAFVAWPLALALTQGGSPLAHLPAVFRLLATLASGLGGPGKLSPSK